PFSGPLIGKPWTRWAGPMGFSWAWAPWVSSSVGTRPTIWGSSANVTFPRSAQALAVLFLGFQAGKGIPFQIGNGLEVQVHVHVPVQFPFHGLFEIGHEIG